MSLSPLSITSQDLVGCPRHPSSSFCWSSSGLGPALLRQLVDPPAVLRQPPGPRKPVPVDVARRPVAEGKEGDVLPVGAIVPALEPRAGVVRNL